MRFLFILLILMPILELFLLIKVGQTIGALPTIALVVLTAFLGLALLQRQGYATLLKARGKIQMGQLPAEEMLNGIFVAAGGMLLLLPGFISDVVGLFCLVPFLRRRLQRGLSRFAFGSMAVRAQYRSGTRKNSASGQTFDGEIIDGDQVADVRSGAITQDRNNGEDRGDGR